MANNSNNNWYPQNGNQQYPQNGNQQYPQNGNQQYPQNGNQQYPQNGYQQYPQNGNQQYPQNGNQQYPQNGYQQYPQNGYQQNKKKKSGAKIVVGTTKEGRQFRGISAWFHRDDCGLVKINAFENSNTPDEVTSNKGNSFLQLMFEVFYQNSGVKRLELGLFNLNSGKVLLKRLGIVISTKAPNGGYAGFFSKKVNN